MTANETLLSRIGRRHTIGREDVATDALAFILERSPAVRSAFANFLGAGEPEAPAIAKVQTQYSLPNGAAPDLACLGEDGKLLAFVESKFWAYLTSNQPVTYWNGLPTDAHATLLFIAPAERIDPGNLWGELEERLRQAGHELASSVCKIAHTISAPAKSGSHRRLMVTSWETLLDYLAQSALEHQDSQASFEIAELQGLANSVIAGSKSDRYDDLNSLVTDAVSWMVQAGWANTDGLSVGVGYSFRGRYLQLAGAYAWFGVHFDEDKRSNRPLWLAFRSNFGGDPGLVTTGQVRKRLANLAPREAVRLEAFSGAFCIPIDLLPGGDSEAAFSSIIAQLTDIARLIDPHIPTYHRDSARAEQP